MLRSVESVEEFQLQGLEKLLAVLEQPMKVVEESQLQDLRQSLAAQEHLRAKSFQRLRDWDIGRASHNRKLVLQNVSPLEENRAS